MRCRAYVKATVGGVRDPKEAVIRRAGSITKEMARYPRELCRAVLRGLTAQLRADRRLIEGCFGIQAGGSAPGAEPAGADMIQAENFALAAELAGGDQDVRRHLYGAARLLLGNTRTTLPGNHSAMIS